MLRFDQTFGVNLGRPTGSGDTGIDGSLALFVEFGSLTEENDGESDTSAHSYEV